MTKPREGPRRGLPAYARQWLGDLADKFWLIPGLLTLLGVLAALGLIAIDRSRLLPHWLLDGAWIYDGGGTGARTLLGAVASSMIGVAGTVFSITIAALSLAAGQMGPRLLRNFTHDRGVQLTLGAFIGTFAYALLVLRSVRTQEEGAFTPHLSMSVAILLALVCVCTLIYFVGHMAGRINVDTVVDLVSEDVRAAMQRLTTDTPGHAPPAAGTWCGAHVVTDARRGYLLHVDEAALADWAAERGTTLKLLARPGDFVFPGAPFALTTTAVDGASEALVAATAIGRSRTSDDDLEYAVRQLVEVAVRALSPGINDPHTALSVLDRLGATLCDVVPVHLPSGVHCRRGRPVLLVRPFDYAGLVDAMFHLIRQNAAGSVAVLARMLEVLTAVASCERSPSRLAELSRHASLVAGDAERDVRTPDDLGDVRARLTEFRRMAADGPGSRR